MDNAGDFGMGADRIQAATEVFSYKWHPVILYAVYELEGAGYSEVEATIDGISSKVLSDGLSDLCECGILATTETVEGSGRMVYELTEKGHTLVPVLGVLDAWKRRYEGEQPSVLIVEDESMVAEVLSGSFPDSYDVEHVRTGEGTLKEYTDDTDLLVVDRKLEGMSGDEVAARVSQQYEQGLVLCVSGIEPDDDIFELETDDYVHKPVGEDEIKTRIELLLNRQGLDPTSREYLSLRSKQVALRDAHGDSARMMRGYRDCETRIEELDLSSEQEKTLEPLLP